MDCPRFATSTDLFGNQVLASISGEGISLVPDEVADGEVAFADAEIGADGKPHTNYLGNNSYTDMWTACEQKARPLASVEADQFYRMLPRGVVTNALVEDWQLVKEWLNTRFVMPDNAKDKFLTALNGRWVELSAMELYRNGGQLDPERYNPECYGEFLWKRIVEVYWPAIPDSAKRWWGAESIRTKTTMLNITTGLDGFFNGDRNGRTRLFKMPYDSRGYFGTDPLSQLAWGLDLARGSFLASMFFGYGSLVDFNGRKELARELSSVASQTLSSLGHHDAAAMVAELVPGNKLRAEKYWNMGIEANVVDNTQAVRIFQSLLYTIGYDSWDGVAENFNRLAALNLARRKNSAAADNYMRAVLALRFGGSFDGARQFIKDNLARVLTLRQGIPNPEDLSMLVQLSTPV